MTFLIFLILVVGAYVWYKMTHFNDSEWVKNRIKGRTDEQVAVIRYFCNDPKCLSKKPISDAEYDEMVLAVLRSNDYKKKALDKIGLDEDQVKEIEPVHFEGFQYDKQSLAKQGDDGKYRSSKYQVSWLFFSSTQVYLYQNTFTSSDTVETPFYDKETGKDILKNVDSNRFAITVPGDKFYCSLEQNDYTENAIRGMKSMLREKKNS